MSARNDCSSWWIDCTRAVRTGRLLCWGGGEVLKSCVFCGKVHEYNADCPKRAEYRNKYHREYKRDSAADRFRNSRKWREKRCGIQRRDCYMCRYCFCVERKINTSDLSVHHIVPIETDYALRLDNDNLITLCRLHHEQAEKGLIKPNILRNLLALKIKI